MKYVDFSLGFRFSDIRVAFYFLQRAVTQPTLRAIAIFFIRCFVYLRTRAFKNDTALPDITEALSRLRQDGIASLGCVFTEQQCADITRFLRDKKIKHKSYRHGEFSVETRPADLRLGDHSLSDLVNCPHILALANSAQLLELARRYLGCTPTISGISARWSFPVDTGNEVVQQFHRDSEDWKAFRILIYLTDVDERSGPHVYVRGTHLDRRSARLKIYSDIEINRKFDPRRIVSQTGQRGFGFVVDTAGLHKGAMPMDVPRLLLSFQYSILPCYLYQYEPVQAELSEGCYAYTNRLIVSDRKVGRGWLRERARQLSKFRI